MEDLKELEEEVCSLVKKFSESLGFLNVEGMKEAAAQFKFFAMPGDISVDEEGYLSDFSETHHKHTNTDKDVGVISPSQKLNKSRRSMFVASKLVLSSDEEDDDEPIVKPINRRKSRKSVCVALHEVSSSASSEEENNEDEDDVENSSIVNESVEYAQNEKMQESDDDEIPAFKPRKRANKIESSSEEDEYNDCLLIQSDGGRRKKDYSTVEDNVMELTKKFHSQTICDSEEEEGESVHSDEAKHKSESEDTESERSLKNFIVSDDDVDNDFEDDERDDSPVRPTRLHMRFSDQQDGSDSTHDFNPPEDDVMKITQKFNGQNIIQPNSEEEEEEEEESGKKNHKSASEDTESDESLKDFIVSDDDNNFEDESVDGLDDDVFKTPRFDKKPAQKPLATMVTPFSATKRILSKIQTPKSVPGTPAYKREFKKIRDNVVKELFQLYNKTVFDSKLPDDLQITWNVRMTKTAGFCYYSRVGNKYTSRIELSDKVIDSTERIRDTLIHEMCHSATWVIDHIKDGHGVKWKYWARKANRIHPDLPIIMRCHAYEIKGKYTYECNGCGKRFERFSKSIKTEKHRCAKCGGIPVLMNDTASSSARKENPYTVFVKENFANIKKKYPGLPHKEYMLKISEMFKESKEKNKENIY